jgi:hypothetical protein
VLADQDAEKPGVILDCMTNGIVSKVVLWQLLTDLRNEVVAIAMPLGIVGVSAWINVFANKDYSGVS